MGDSQVAEAWSDRGARWGDATLLGDMLIDSFSDETVVDVLREIGADDVTSVTELLVTSGSAQVTSDQGEGRGMPTRMDLSMLDACTASCHLSPPVLGFW